MFEIGSCKNCVSKFLWKRYLPDLITGYNIDNLFLTEYTTIATGCSELTFSRYLFYTAPDVHVAGEIKWWEKVICSH